ncbi:NAD(P)-dependent oxidoreductase [Sphingomonas gilva]|uniref:NAD(P)-dependent oxidoreductase n=1 Tax=Sphingomonas gilva TaxID=2305907 RepID=A0A396RNQ5_9SPHN|nr:NAD(P)-dependent oxidoreductase [Sphingomonas gilva]RHW18009.1 NAD(P)-dependent oxidoreductase [Sphingomonas gilva]
MSVLAVTGGTGFVGSALIERAVREGHQVRALTRREQPPRDGVAWIAGALDDQDALFALAQGADAVVHVAGVVNARDRAGFTAGNVDGTRRMLDAARDAGVHRFIHVSSLSAREPDLSEYGRSKAEAEALVTASGLDWTIARPPAVYGPGDTEMRDLFRLAARGLALLPPEGRLSVIEVGDLARLLLALALSNEGAGATYEPDDGKPGGWSHKSFARAIAQATGRERVLTLPIPARIMRLAARGDRLVRRGGAKLTLDRVGYFCHPDWVVSEGRMPPSDLWKPEVPTLAGLRRTAQWYRARGLL